MSESLPKLSSQMELEAAEKDLNELDGQWMIAALFLVVDAVAVLFAMLALYCFPVVFGRVAATGNSLGFTALSFLAAGLLELFFVQERFKSSVENFPFLLPSVHAFGLLIMLIPAILVCAYEYTIGHQFGFGWTCLHLIVCSVFSICAIRLFRQRLKVRRCEANITEEVSRIMDELIYSDTES